MRRARSASCTSSTASFSEGPMPQSRFLAAAASHPAERLIAERVTAGAIQWFPDLAGTPTVRIQLLSRRPGCLLYVAHLGEGADCHRVVAKVRQPVASKTERARHEVRPGLRRELVTASLELAALEYDGLREIERVVGPDHPMLGVVRPLDLVPGQPIVLMDYVEATTLRDRCVARNRLTSLLRIPRAQVLSPEPWRRAGEWLRRYQREATHAESVADLQRRHEVVDRFEAYADFLARRLGRRESGDLAREGAAWAATVLPDRLPIALGHGDFAPRNLFVDARQRVTVFDPMPRWRVPVYEDPSRLVVGLRLLGLQVQTRGAAFRRGDVEAVEEQVYAGCFRDEMPFEQLRCYQLLVLLDKWSALVELAQSRRSGVRGSVYRFTNGYLRREARRLLPDG